jgi:hypothetical protein
MPDGAGRGAEGVNGSRAAGVGIAQDVQYGRSACGGGVVAAILGPLS